MSCGGKILILGYGNPLRGDDGFGCEVARRLAASVQDPRVEIRELHQLTPELADPVSQAGHVIFIDAEREGEPGEIRRAVIEPAATGSFTHHMTPATLLACSRELYGHAPAATLFTAAGSAFGYATNLSEPSAAALPDLCRQVLSLLQEL